MGRDVMSAPCLRTDSEKKFGSGGRESQGTEEGESELEQIF